MGTRAAHRTPPRSPTGTAKKPKAAVAAPPACVPTPPAAAAVPVALNFTPRIRRFCDEYLAAGESNGAEAARAAGYSARRAKHQARELLRRPDVQQYLAERRAPVLRELAAKHKVTLERIIEENALIAFSDIGDVVELDDFAQVKFKDLETMAPAARRTIASISSSPTKFGTRRSVTLWSKDSALDRLERILDAKPPDGTAVMTFAERAAALAEIIAVGTERRTAASGA